MLGRALGERGHHVIWWTANFAHHFKHFRSLTWQDIKVDPLFQIRLVPTTDYYKNISLGRIRFELLYSWRMYNRAIQELSPDCIISVAPNSFNNPFAVRLSKHFDVPLILDFFDLYPEMFAFALPEIIRPLAPIMFAPLYWLRRQDLNQADAITAVCDSYLETALRIAPRVPKNRSLTVYIGVDTAKFREKVPSIQEIDLVTKRYNKYAGEVWAIYAGSLGNNYDIDTLLQAGLRLEKQGSKVKIQIAGDGPLRTRIIQFIESRQMSHLTYLGKLDVDELIKLYRISDIGLSPYAPGSTVSMPTKVYDYLAAGLPIVNSLGGDDVESLLREKQIGIQYEAGNPISLANALEYLASHPDQRRMMAQNSFDAAMQFDQHVQYGRFVDFIEQVVSGRGKITA